MKKVIYLILFSISTTSIAQDLENGLVAKYLFNGNFSDSSLTRNDLELHNQAYPMTFGTDRYGNNNSSLEIPDQANDIKFLVTKNANTAYDFSNEFSISYWIDFSSYVPDGYIIYGGNPNGYDIDFGLSTNSGYLYYENNTFWDVQIHSGSTNRQFIHHVITYKDGLLSAYINGAKSFFEFNINYQNVLTNKLVIGKFSDTGFGNGGYVGYLDDIYVYDRAITETEISLLYGDRPVASKEIKNSELSISPNPAVNQLSISVEAKHIEIYSMEGKLLSSFNNKNIIDISQLPKGIYLLKATSVNDKLFTKKFVKK